MNEQILAYGKITLVLFYKIILTCITLAIGPALKRYRWQCFATGIVLLLLRPFQDCQSIVSKSASYLVHVPNSRLWIVPIKNYSRNGLSRLDFNCWHCLH